MRNLLAVSAGIGLLCVLPATASAGPLWFELARHIDGPSEGRIASCGSHPLHQPGFSR